MGYDDAWNMTIHTTATAVVPGRTVHGTVDQKSFDFCPKVATHAKALQKFRSVGNHFLFHIQKL